MESTDESELSRLENCSYRYLQQRAKSMALPSNVKKVYLIKLIHTRLFGTEHEVDLIINQVKRERLQLAQVRKRRGVRRMRLQGEEISSTSEHIRSPPITATPRRAGPIIVRCSPIPRRSNQHRTSTYTSTKTTEPTTTHTNSTTKAYIPPKKPECDRVLRNRTYPICKFKKPDSYHEVLNINNSVIGLIRGRNMERENSSRGLREMKVYRRKSQHSILNNQSLLNVQKNCIVRHRPSILSSNSPQRLIQKIDVASANDCRAQIMPMLTSSVAMSPLPTPAKRKRALSGIYPINQPDPPKTTYEYIQSGLGIRNRDGTISKINALVQKPSNNYNNSNRMLTTNFDATIQDIINTNIDNMSLNNQFCKRYINTDVLAKTTMAENTFTHTETNSTMAYEFETPVSMVNYQLDATEELNSVYSQYCHKKIRAEQVRHRRISAIGYKRESVKVVEESLPRIHEVFSNFSEVTQPIYVGFNAEAEPMPSYATYEPPQATPMLETIYNIKNQFLYHAPLVPVPTTSNTKCVFSTPVVATARAQCTASTNMQYSVPSYEVVNNTAYNYIRQYEPETRFNTNVIRQSQETTLSSSSQVRPPAGTGSPDMDDALELISQDTDYMERLEMDVQTQCLLCAWTGPSVVLEPHIRKEHQPEILSFSSTEWHAPFTVGAMTSRVIRREAPPSPH
ncbi:unnamed protein product [Plutella xylostella]|uniref:(diamondback moth) hypothetical protein n=1 Tax=Plutella xylostella TaxID=51655 RepID=A0A8S4G5I3_PLUXY|nr:unnamed protein product [Plutella xylostella]